MLPKMMKAIAISKPGGPDVLKLIERERPTAETGEVVIKVAYAGVNRPDCLQRAGAYPPPKGASDLPGLEVSGEIVETGNEVPRALAGKSVMALTPGGGYAEYVRVHHTHVLPIPSRLSLQQAAAVPETYFTVWHNVFQRGGLRAGETFLVHGGTSGIGTTAIQLAKAFGARVVTTAGTEEKCAFCRTIGADLAVNYKQENYVDSSRDFTEGRGVDLILDMVGGDYIERNFDACAEDGRIVQIAFLSGSKVEVNFAKLMVKRLTLTGSTLRPQTNAFKARIAEALREQVWPLVEDGSVFPVMDEVFELADAASAHEKMEAGKHIGKIVLKVHDE